MNASTSMKALKYIFAFPFQDGSWQSKFAIGSGLIFAGYFIPVLPLIPVLGYVARIMRSVAQDDGLLKLPEWDDWSSLFTDGLRLMLVSALLLLPAILIMFIGWGAYFGSVFGMVLSGEYGEPGAAGPFILLFPLAMFFMFFAQFISMLLSTVALFLFPPSLTHVAANRSARTFFNSGWWRVLAANPGGFFLAAFVSFGLAASIYGVFIILYMSLVLCCVLPFVLAPASFYTMLVCGAVGAQAYREGQDKIAAREENTAPAEPGSFAES